MTDPDDDNLRAGFIIGAMVDLVGAFAEECPEEGTDPAGIAEWYRLMNVFSAGLRSLCQWFDWPAGATLAGRLVTQLRATPGDDEADTWFAELDARCSALAAAADARWPDPDDAEEAG